MDTEQLRAFVAVARTRRFTRAARLVGVSQPSLSRRVQHLEKELGAKLLIRSPAGLVLTGAGERFLVQAERALASIDAAIAELDELAGKPRGVVSLGTLPTVGAYALPAVLAAFRRRHAEVRVRLIEGFPDELEEKVAGGELDLAILNLPVRRLDLAAQRLWQEDYVLAVPTGHRLAALKRAIALPEAAGEPFVVIPNVPATRAIEAACDERGVQPSIVLETDNLESVRRMVEQGLGVALIPRLVARAEGTKRFVAIDVSRGGFKRQVALVHRGEGYLGAASRALRAILVESLKRKGRPTS
jgi:DNA-binding transcriptional LysR family regulator